MLTSQRCAHFRRQCRRVRVTLVVPCYNEEQRLPADVFRKFAAGDASLDFLFVDDGSTDGTARVLEDLRRQDPLRIAVLTLEKNSGKAEAVRRGMVAAMERGPDVVGFWDADLATPLTELPSVVSVLTSRPEIEMVFGARVRLLGREISRRPWRHYVGRIGATLISSTLGLPVYDTQCGAKLFRLTDATPLIFATPFQSRWIFDVEIVARFVSLRGRDQAARSIYELPITEWNDVHGSKVKGRDFARALRDLWKIRGAYKR